MAAVPLRAGARLNPSCPAEGSPGRSACAPARNDARLTVALDLRTSVASYHTKHAAAGWRRVALRAAVCLAVPATLAAAQDIPASVQWPSSRMPGPGRSISLLGPPRLVVGSPHGPEAQLLSGVVGATLLPDGGVAVADGSLQRVLFFGADGDLRRIAGRDGDGPGEFRFLRWLGRCVHGRALLAFDGGSPSVTSLSQRAEPPIVRSLSSRLSFQQPLACIHPDTMLFVLEGPATALPPGRFANEPTAVVRAVHGRDLDTLASGQGRIFYFSRRMPGAYADVPLRPTTLAAVGSSRIFVVESGSDSIRVLDLDGVPTSTLVLGLRRVEASRAHWNRSVSERKAREPLQRTRLILDSVLAELGPARDLPMIAEIAADSENRIWARTFDNYLSPYATWLVISSSGRQVARVVAPRSLRPLEIGRGYLIGVARDADDVETVVLFRFQALPES